MNQALIAALETALALAKADGGAVAPAGNTYEGRLSPELLAIPYYRHGTDYAGRPTNMNQNRAPAIPSQLDEIGAYTVRTWTKQTPPVSFGDYLWMLHDLVPTALTDAQRFNVRAGAMFAYQEIPGATVDMPYLELADRWLFPGKYKTAEQLAQEARDVAEANANWDSKYAPKPKPPVVPVVGTE